MLAGGAVVLALILWVPIDRGLDNFPYYEAHGLSILALANREWAWPLDRIENALVVLVLLANALLLLVGDTAPSPGAVARGPGRDRRGGGAARVEPHGGGLRVDRGARLQRAASSGTSPSRTTGSTTLREGAAS